MGAFAQKHSLRGYYNYEYTHSRCTNNALIVQCIRSLLYGTHYHNLCQLALLTLVVR